MKVKKRGEALRLLHEPDDWGPGTEDTSKRIDEILYEDRGTRKGALRGFKTERSS